MHLSQIGNCLNLWKIITHWSLNNNFNTTKTVNYQHNIYHFTFEISWSHKRFSRLDWFFDYKFWKNKNNGPDDSLFEIVFMVLSFGSFISMIFTLAHGNPDKFKTFENNICNIIHDSSLEKIICSFWTGCHKKSLAR